MESPLLDTARVVMHDHDLRDRVRVALTGGGYHVADLDQFLTWLLSSPALAEVMQALVDDPAVQAILDDHPHLTGEGAMLASLVTVTTSGPALAPVHKVDSTVIPDSLIIAGIRAAHEQRARWGLPITRADDTNGGA